MEALQEGWQAHNYYGRSNASSQLDLSESPLSTKAPGPSVHTGAANATASDSLFLPISSVPTSSSDPQSQVSSPLDHLNERDGASREEGHQLRSLAGGYQPCPVPNDEGLFVYAPIVPLAPDLVKRLLQLQALEVKTLPPCQHCCKQPYPFALVVAQGQETFYTGQRLLHRFSQEPLMRGAQSIGSNLYVVPYHNIPNLNNNNNSRLSYEAPDPRDTQPPLSTSPELKHPTPPPSSYYDGSSPSTAATGAGGDDSSQRVLGQAQVLLHPHSLITGTGAADHMSPMSGGGLRVPGPAVDKQSRQD